jgi:hypothetical protein
LAASIVRKYKYASTCCTFAQWKECRAGLNYHVEVEKHYYSVKAKVEVAVLLATRWIIAKLRNRQFFTLTDLNDAIRDCVTALNARVTRHLGTSRRALFDEIERPALKPRCESPRRPMQPRQQTRRTAPMPYRPSRRKEPGNDRRAQPPAPVGQQGPRAAAASDSGGHSASRAGPSC